MFIHFHIGNGTVYRLVIGSNSRYHAGKLRVAPTATAQRSVKYPSIPEIGKSQYTIRLPVKIIAFS